jgi:hypothetical protein
MSGSLKKPLSSVHEALHNASMADAAPGDPVSFRLDPDVKEQVSAICYHHGTTLSEFVRQCCLSLVSDYMDSSRG